MTTNAQFDFRGVDDARDQVTRDDVRSLLSGPELAAMLPPGSIGTQSAVQGAGIPLSAVRRGLLMLSGRLTAHYTVTSTAWTEIDSVNLAGTLVCTGRPVRVDIETGCNKGATTGIILSAQMDGVEVSGKTDGLIWNFSPEDLYVSGWHILTPRPGPRRFAMVAAIYGAGTATMYAGAGDAIQMAVCEL